MGKPTASVLRASLHAGCSRDAIMAAVDRGEIAMVRIPDLNPRGYRYELDPASFARWLATRQEPDWPAYTTAQASNLAGFGRQYLGQAIRAGELEAVKVGKDYRVRQDSFHVWLADRLGSATVAAGVALTLDEAVARSCLSRERLIQAIHSGHMEAVSIEGTTLGVTPAELDTWLPRRDQPGAFLSLTEASAMVGLGEPVLRLAMAQGALRSRKGHSGKRGTVCYVLAAIDLNRWLKLYHGKFETPPRGVELLTVPQANQEAGIIVFGPIHKGELRAYRVLGPSGQPTFVIARPDLEGWMQRRDDLHLPRLTRDLLTVRQAARLSGTTQDPIRDAVEAGELAVQRVVGPRGKRCLALSRSEFLPWLERYRAESHPSLEQAAQLARVSPERLQEAIQNEELSSQGGFIRWEQLQEWIGPTVRLLGVQEAATQVGLQGGHLRRAMEQGRLRSTTVPAARGDYRYVIRSDDLEAWFADYRHDLEEPGPDWVTLAELARQQGIPYPLLTREARAGRLRAAHIPHPVTGRAWAVKPADAARWLESYRARVRVPENSLTLQQIQQMGYSKATVNHAIQSGELPAVKVEGSNSPTRWFVTEADLQAWIERRK